MNSDTISSLIQALLSPDNKIRSEAEKQLIQLKTQNKDSLILSLINFMENEKNSSLLQMALVYVRKNFLSNSNEIQEQLREKLITIIDKIVLSGVKMHMHVCAQIYCQVYSFSNQIQFLLGKIIQTFTSSQLSVIKIFSLQTIDVLCENHLEQNYIESNIDNFIIILNQGFENTDLTVRIASLKATSNLISCIEDSKLVMKFEVLIDKLMMTLIDSLKTSEDDGREVLEEITTLTEFQPDIWRNHFLGVINIGSQIIDANHFQISTRASAIEFLLSIIKEYPKQMSNMKEIKTLFFPCLLKMLTEVKYKNELEKWSKDLEDKETDTDPFNTASSAISRLSTFLGANATIALTQEHLMNYLNDEDWTKKAAGICCIGLIAEGAKERMKEGNTLSALMSNIIKYSQDSNIRVVYACITAIALLCGEICPEIQIKYHKHIIPLLIKYMQTESPLIMKIQATSAIISFCKGIIEEEENEVLNIYANPLLESLGKLLGESIEKNCQSLMDEVLTSLSMIATVLSDKFSNYYDAFVPFLKKIIASTPNETQKHKQIRANCIKTLGFMVSAVASQKEKFMADIVLITDEFVKIFASNLKEDDPQLLALMNSIPNLASAMGINFTKYLSYLVPRLIKEANTSLDVQINEKDDPSAITKEDDMVLSIKGFNININTAAFQTKIAACTMLSDLCEHCQSGFKPYLDQVLYLFISFLSLKKSRSLRKSAMKTFKHFFNCVGADEDKLKLMNLAIPEFLNLLDEGIKCHDYREIKMFLKQLEACIMLMPKVPFFDQPTLTRLINGLSNSVKLARDFQNVKTKEQKKKFELTEEDEEIIEEEFSNMSLIIERAMECSSSLIKTHKEKCFTEIVNIIVPLYVEILQAANSEDRPKLCSMCLFCDLIEFMPMTQEQREKAAQMILPYYLKAMVSNDLDTIQSAGYSLGVLAQYTPKILLPVREEAVKLLEKIILKINSRDESCAISTEVCIGALGKICYFLYDEKEVGVHRIELFLNNLPLVAEDEEAQNVHRQFVEMILNQNMIFKRPDIKTLVQLAFNKIINAYKIQGKSNIIKIEDQALFENANKILSTN